MLIRASAGAKVNQGRSGEIAQKKIKKSNKKSIVALPLIRIPRSTLLCGMALIVARHMHSR